MIEAAASCALLLLILFGGIPLLRWRDYRRIDRMTRDEAMDFCWRLADGAGDIDYEEMLRFERAAARVKRLDNERAAAER